MKHGITPHKEHVEIKILESMTQWDLLHVVHELYRMDPRKQTPDLWTLDASLDLSRASIPIIIRAIWNLASRLISGGASSAIVSATPAQHKRVLEYCEKAAPFPYKVKCFTDLDTARRWLLNS